LEDVKVGAPYVLEHEVLGLGKVLEEVYAALQWGGVGSPLNPRALV
jgi:hypothetical protein